MQIGAPWAYEALQRNYFPEDEVPEPSYEDAGDVAVHCPKCHSTEVVFDRLVNNPPEGGHGPAPKFHWTCGLCGYEWEDEGVETKE